jgi:hypothetical protein
VIYQWGLASKEGTSKRLRNIHWKSFTRINGEKYRIENKSHVFNRQDEVKV